jgi:hypothetical protein
MVSVAAATICARLAASVTVCARCPLACMSKY